MGSKSLCPACGIRPQTVSELGLCAPCADQRIADRYLERDRPAIVKRQEDWRARSPKVKLVDTVGARERQRRKRLLTRTRPRDPAPAYSDPLVLADEAVSALGLVRQHSRTEAAAGAIDRAIEIVRQLAWGPMDPSGPSTRYAERRR